MFWTLYNIYPNCFAAEFNMLLKLVQAQKLKKERLEKAKKVYSENIIAR